MSRDHRAAARLAFAVVFAAAPAVAEQVRPASDGSIGALLVAAPVDARKFTAQELAPALEQPVGPVRYLPVAASAGSAIDLSTRVPKGKSALVGGSIALRAPVRALFLISTSGSGELFVDGRRVGSVVSTSGGAAWYPIEAQLERGTRSFALRLLRSDRPLSVRLRVLGVTDLRPLPDTRLLLSGVDTSTVMGTSWLHADLGSGLSATGYAPVLRLSAPGGAPAGVFPVQVARDGEAPVALGTFAGGERGVLDFEAQLPPVEQPAHAVRYRLKVGDVAREFTLAFAPEAPALLARAEQTERKLRVDSATFLDAAVLRATLLTRIGQLQAAKSAAQTRSGMRQLESLMLAISQRQDPLKTPGIHELARFSDVSRVPDPMRLHVPPGAGEKPLPLVVLLHGMNGTPKGVMDAFLDDGSDAPRVAGYLLAPYAHGNAFYRGPGEYEVMDAIKWALGVLPIDKSRVSITGVSMGGTGTAHLATRHPDVLSAAAPLCGYHSYFVRRDTSNRPLAAWERSRMAHWSPASWAEAGRDLPWWIAHGKKDFPLENSKVLIAALKAAQAKVTEEWPDTGHAVWEKTYAGARMFSWLSTQSRPQRKRAVRIVTDSYRHATQRWLSITRLGTPGSMARVQAEVDGSTLRIQTENVNGLAVDRALLAEPGVDAVQIDGAEVAKGAGTWSFSLSKGAWQKGDARPAATEKQLGAEGPIRDVFNAPVVFSYGTAEPGTARAAREVAEAWAARFGAEAVYPVVPDHALYADAVRDVNLVIVGTPQSHRFLRRHGAGLSLTFEGATLKMGAHRFTGRTLGAAFVAQSPLRRDRSWLVVISRNAAGLHLSRSLPALLPDFIVYDDRVAGAAGEQVLGETKVVAAGFLGHDFRPPATLEPAADGDASK